MFTPLYLLWDHWVRQFRYAGFAKGVSITVNAIRASVESVTDRHFRGGHLALGIILYATLAGIPRLTTTKLS